MTKYVIAQASRRSMRWRLRKLGITRALLFPSLNSLAYDVVQIAKEKYGHAMTPELAP